MSACVCTRTANRFNENASECGMFRCRQMRCVWKAVKLVKGGRGEKVGTDEGDDWKEERSRELT